MISNLLKYFRLLYLIARHGSFMHSGHDFSRKRHDSLQALRNFTPGRTTSRSAFGLKIRSFFWRYALTRTVMSEAAFVKTSLFRQGGHLHNPFLNISYVRIPKSASTSLAFVMLRTIYKDISEGNLSTAEINYLADVNLRKTIPLQTSEIFFTSVRNPFARIVSVYRDFFENATDEFLYEDYLFGILAKDLSFKIFVRRLQQIPDLLKDQHLKPQHLFLDYYKKRQQQIVILKMDKPGEIASFLSIYDLEIPTLNQSTDPYDYRSYYDLETFDTVARIYEKDIKMFHYEQEVQALKVFLYQSLVGDR
ncbi:sulfotransferase family 2 domain-containing protein [Fulvivirgaceae bacterium PWU4]|uniref:Sulfotransferase family 2 domain-containing protein n=1 Tax=Chryseosolibacter histidini TaxID=2782349 RepID=A0AAP2DKB4_9BACT|nr:sulfotransferase family 2 domain-containing protein [Chryseosolibacter histidini]MBT1697968.1 sulfotransferase family 2 domain-containing protein [Chryseosolibacter histidini]